MSTRRPSHAVVSLAALDLRRRPDHRSELTSQLLLGEVVRVLSGGAGGSWWRVQNLADGDRGWARTWGLVGVSRARAMRWTRRARARAVRSFSEIVVRPGSSTLVSPLVLNSRVIAGRARGRFRSVELPDGRRGWVASSALRSGSSRIDLVARVRSLLGVPYLWGGRTPLGFDCSGFTQQVLLEQGIALPRDAREQFRACSRLRAGDSHRTGDLVFFGVRGGPAGHVGLMMGGGYFAHARGHVRVSSLDVNNSLCDMELMPQLRGFGRPRKGPSRWPCGGLEAGESA